MSGKTQKAKKATQIVEIDEAWFDDVSPHVFLAVQNLAKQWLEKQPDRGSLRTLALANEAYLRASRPGLEPKKEPLEFALQVARALRSMLVERAKTVKDSGAIPLSPERGAGGVAMDALALDKHLTALRREDPLAAEVAELVYFAGLSLDDIAKLTDASAGSVRARWNAATLWLRKHGQAPTSGTGSTKKKRA